MFNHGTCCSTGTGGDNLDVSPLLRLSAFGIYFHSVFVAITLGFPVAIMALLFKYSRTSEEHYMRAAKRMTMVLAVNFALGAVTGTLVEFGLVQAWPGTILAIASFVFAPLALELIAFANEIALLVLFIVTLGRIKPAKSLVILFFYWIFALTSGVLITTVNSWLVAPWGTGIVPAAIYPFMPEFGPLAMDAQKLVILKILLLASEKPLQAIIQNPEVSQKVGVILFQPTIALNFPYALWSDVHNLLAGIIVGMSIALAAWAFRYLKTGDEKYISIVRSFMPILLVFLVIQPLVVGHFMAEQVVHYNPTKFSMMEDARESYNNPLVALLAYGDPSHPIVGFDEYYRKCEEHRDATLGDLAGKLGVDENTILATAKELGISLTPEKLRGVLAIKLKDVCIADLQKAEERIGFVHAAYYTKIAGGVVAFLAVIALAGILYSIPVISAISKGIFGDRVFLLSLLVAGGSITSAVLGWAVREVGRKPWTVYGLLWPEELVSANAITLSPSFIAFMALVIMVVGVGGLFAMYIVATKEFRRWMR